MKQDSWNGLVIRRHTEEGFIDEGRIVHEELERGRYYWIPNSGKDKHDRRHKHHVKRTLVGYRSELAERLGPEPGKVSLVHYEPKGLQAYSEATLRDMAADLHRKDRRDIERSLAIKDEQWGWIEPYVVGNPIECLLDEPAVQAFARKQAKTAGVTAKRIVRALRVYLQGGLMKEALLPRWDRCNAPGKPKLPRADATGNCPTRTGLGWCASRIKSCAPRSPTAGTRAHWSLTWRAAAW